MRTIATAAASLGAFVQRARRAGGLVVQPRMGMSSPEQMRAGLLATRDSRATTIGTITVDSYTRIGDQDRARAALASGTSLNGYPIVVHDVTTTRAVIDGLQGWDFPIQVRHGSPNPNPIIDALIAAGLDASEGGPVSYCLPYGRTPLRDAVDNWARGCPSLARFRTTAQDTPREPVGNSEIYDEPVPSSMRYATFEPTSAKPSVWRTGVDTWTGPRPSGMPARAQVAVLSQFSDNQRDHGILDTAGRCPR